MSTIRELRLQQAYNIVVAAGGGGATIAQVAAGLCIAPSPYVRDMLSDMVRYGWLVAEQSVIETSRGLRMGWVYRASCHVPVVSA